MASKAAHKRLNKEYVAMQKEPPPFVWAVPDEKNILTWNYIIRGPPDSPFAGGEYHGVLLFPPEYPFKPPGIKMLTPSGRFQPDRKICFSMSDFHPGSWNPAWSVATILTGLLSFMLSDEMTTGSVTTSDSDKRAYAARSHTWNLEQRRFKEAFPDFCSPTARPVPNMAEKENGGSSKVTGPTSTPSLPSTPATTNATPTTASPTPTPPTSGQVTPSHTPSTPGPNEVARTPGREGAGGGGWSSVWRQLIWEKWRWGVVLALALIVSRLSSA
ncbi:Ubiquitin-conjugating enzyme E2 6 [Steccherinum ochraceum]|uniref:Ubiquitin-conjugating enzyme E2 6 n=1 Tax=Steccherinum ochraceum TaxID=92696 RepID=A0A4V2MX86_9APHY|nr:Ubiquitin-conjugating enzyme E2 6 [Steccherinum ochraceum]